MYTEEATREPEISITESETAQGLSTKTPALEQKIEACKALYLAYQGRHHEAIEREMRGLGYKNFTRRVLYTRNQHGRTLPGWPERFGWNSVLPLKREATDREDLERSETPSTSQTPSTSVSQLPPSSDGGTGTDNIGPALAEHDCARDSAREVSRNCAPSP